MIDFTIDKEKHVKFILNNFDFEKVHKIMTLLNWEWLDFTNFSAGVPKIERMKEKVTEMLYSICDSEADYVESGGFRVIKYDDHLELDFVANSIESSFLNSGLDYEKKKRKKERKNKIKKIGD
jgi:hypothetical protein